AGLLPLVLGDDFWIVAGDRVTGRLLVPRLRLEFTDGAPVPEQQRHVGASPFSRTLPPAVSVHHLHQRRPFLRRKLLDDPRRADPLRGEGINTLDGEGLLRDRVQFTVALLDPRGETAGQQRAFLPDVAATICPRLPYAVGLHRRFAVPAAQFH